MNLKFSTITRHHYSSSQAEENEFCLSILENDFEILINFPTAEELSKWEHILGKVATSKRTMDSQGTQQALNAFIDFFRERSNLQVCHFAHAVSHFIDYIHFSELK
jgi:hypothetical protein